MLWVHAVSLGEVSAIVPFVKTLHQRYPATRIVVSTVTETGREAVQQRLAGIATHCYLPLDYPWIVNRFIHALNPIGFVVVETELWPNLLRELSRRGVPSVILNGRLSSPFFCTIPLDSAVHVSGALGRSHWGSCNPSGMNNDFSSWALHLTGYAIRET